MCKSMRRVGMGHQGKILEESNIQVETQKMDQSSWATGWGRGVNEGLKEERTYLGNVIYWGHMLL